MSTAAEVKRLSVVHALLLRAATYLYGDLPDGIPAKPVLLADVTRQLSEAALLEGMRALADKGKRSTPKAGFWRDMERASAALGRDAEAAHFAACFTAALRESRPDAQGVMN